MPRFENEDKKNYWKLKIEEYERSNMTQSNFCQAHQLKYYQFKYWIDRLRIAPSTKSDFSLVRLPKDKKPSSMTLVFESGIKIEFGTVPEVVWIKNLLSSL